MAKLKKTPPQIVTDTRPTSRHPDGRYRVKTGAREETYEVIRGIVLRVVE
jgi:hypothetical protein